MRKFLTIILSFLTKPLSKASQSALGEIQNARSETGADVQWFFNTLDPSLKKIGDEKWELRYNKFSVLCGDLIDDAKKKYKNRRKNNGAIMCLNVSGLNDKENIRIILENINRMKEFSKDFYNKMNEILCDWFTKVLLQEPAAERLYQSSLKENELIEMQYLNDAARYYEFILKNEGSFIFNVDGMVPIKEYLVDEYKDLDSKMRESLGRYMKNNLFDTCI